MFKQHYIWTVDLILRKIMETVATRTHILGYNTPNSIYFGWGSAPDPAGGAHSVSYRIGVEKRRLGSLFVLLLVSHFITITYHSN